MMQHAGIEVAKAWGSEGMIVFQADAKQLLVVGFYGNTFMSSVILLFINRYVCNYIVNQVLSLHIDRKTITYWKMN